MTAGTDWNDPSSAVLTDAEVPVSSLSDLSSEVDLDQCVGMFSVAVALTYNASATEAAVLRIYGKIDGTNYGNEPIYERTLPANTLGSAYKLGPIPFPIPCQCIKVAIYNPDATYTITSLTAYVHKNVLSAS